MRSIIKWIKRHAADLSRGTVRETCSPSSVLIRRCVGLMLAVFGRSCKRKLLLLLISWGPDVRRWEAASLPHWRSGRGFQLTKSLRAQSDVSSISGLTHQELYQTAPRVFWSNWQGSYHRLICQILFWRTDSMTYLFQGYKRDSPLT